MIRALWQTYSSSLPMSSRLSRNQQGNAHRAGVSRRQSLLDGLHVPGSKAQRVADSSTSRKMLTALASSKQSCRFIVAAWSCAEPQLRPQQACAYGSSQSALVMGGRAGRWVEDAVTYTCERKRCHLWSGRRGISGAALVAASLIRGARALGGEGGTPYDTGGGASETCRCPLLRGTRSPQPTVGVYREAWRP